MHIYLFKLSLYLFIGLAVLKLPTLEPLIDSFCLILAKVMANVLSVFDEGIERSGNIVFRYTYGYALTISKECSALEFVVAFAAAVMALPISIAQRVQTIILFSFAFELVNILRLMTLIYSKLLFSPHNFDIIHEQFWPLLLTISATAIFYFILRNITIHTFWTTPNNENN